MKRTTLILEDGCMDGVREIAARERRQISEVVNELLAEGLARRAPGGGKPLVLPTSRWAGHGSTWPTGMRWSRRWSAE